MATKKKKDFSNAFGFDVPKDEELQKIEPQEDKIESDKTVKTKSKKPDKIAKKDTSEAETTSISETAQVVESSKNQEIENVVINDDENIVVTYHNPMKILVEEVSNIQKRIAEEENEILSGFRKKPSQFETYANATVHVRRDLYGAIDSYIKSSGLIKSKVLNEIFMSGIDVFINKYTKKKNS
jgi:hypothetical protein